MAANYNFSGKSVLVTGGSKGIGLQLVLRLAESSAKVFCLSRSNDLLANAMRENPSLSIEYFKCDLSNWSETSRVVQFLPHVDYVVNNAGVGILKTFGNIDEEELDITFNLNVKAVVNITQTISKRWIDNGFKGVVVNVSSQASKRAIPEHTTYCASKAALDALTRSMALELGVHGIRVISVNPTAILTDMGRLYWENEVNKTKLTSRLPIRRLGEVDEAVKAIMFLLTDDSSLITGSCLALEGGFWAC